MLLFDIWSPYPMYIGSHYPGLVKREMGTNLVGKRETVVVFGVGVIGIVNLKGVRLWP